MNIVKRALISVSNKTDLTNIAHGLFNEGFEIVSTGGTADAIELASIPVTRVEQVTGFPEMMDGRLKTLHPLIFGGLLGRPDRPDHLASMFQYGIRRFDIVYVNLYPFREKVAAGCSHEEIVENIDIGGPSLLCAAAKNYPFLYVLTSPNQFGSVFSALATRGTNIDPALSLQLAKEAFKHVAEYRTAVSEYFATL